MVNIDKLTYAANLVPGTFVLLQGPRTAFRLLHVSTDEVYGTLGPEGLFWFA